MDYLMKWKYIVKNRVEKHCDKSRNYAWWAISPFATMLSKVVGCWGVRKRLHVGKVWKISFKPFHKYWHIFEHLQQTTFKIIVAKVIIATLFSSLFNTNTFIYIKRYSIFLSGCFKVICFRLVLCKEGLLHLEANTLFV